MIGLTVDVLRGSDQVKLGSLKVVHVMALHNAHIIHFTIHARDAILGVPDVSNRFPVFHHGHEVVGVLFEPVIHGASHDSLSVVVGPAPLPPDLERPRNSLKVGPCESVGHAPLTHPFKVTFHDGVPRALVRMLLC